MRARQFAICDSDSQYLRMLQAYLQKRKLADFEILVLMRWIKRWRQAWRSRLSCS